MLCCARACDAAERGALAAPRPGRLARDGIVFEPAVHSAGRAVGVHRRVRAASLEPHAVGRGPSRHGGLAPAGRRLGHGSVRARDHPRRKVRGARRARHAGRHREQSGDRRGAHPVWQRSTLVARLAACLRRWLAEPRHRSPRPGPFHPGRRAGPRRRAARRARARGDSGPVAPAQVELDTEPRAQNVPSRASNNHREELVLFSMTLQRRGSASGMRHLVAFPRKEARPRLSR